MAQGVFGHRVTIEDPPIAQTLFADTRFAWFWLIVRVYTGYQWLMAGLEKFSSSAWVGSQAGTGLGGFIKGAVGKAAGDHPSVFGWYGTFLSTLVLPHLAIWSYLITFGEIAVGLGLIVGCLTGVAAFFGGMMNANYLMAGTVSSNPLLFIFATWLVLAWKVAGYYGIDFVLLPALGVPGHPGKLFGHGAEAKQQPRPLAG